MVSVFTPAVADAATVRFSAAAVVFAGIVVGANAPPTPAGSPLTVSVTAPANPPARPMLRVTAPVFPILMETAELVTVRVNVPWLLGPPGVPPPQAAPRNPAARAKNGVA